MAGCDFTKKGHFWAWQRNNFHLDITASIPIAARSQGEGSTGGDLEKPRIDQQLQRRI